jgi:hypothetical protein
MKCLAILEALVCLLGAVRLEAACPDGRTRPCRASGRPGTQECVNGRWSRCLPDDPGPLPTPTPPPPPPDGPVAAPAHEVRAQANPLAVDQATAFTDCCVTCEHQTLEAITPTPDGPRPHGPGEPLPLRQTFCGTVAKYEVNDEVDDPRDICINLRPLPIAPFPDFVAGFVRTAGTPLQGPDQDRFGHAACDESACAARAPQIAGKVIHAEVTPDQSFYRQDRRFLPIAGGGACSDSDETCKSELEPEGGGAKDVCVHGVYAYDHGPDHDAGDHRRLCCVAESGHDHPEIHPFDAIWWKDPRKNGWVFGVFQDDSNRYSSPHCGDNNGARWSQAPRDVTFRFPFRFKRSAGCRRAQLRHVRTTNFGGAAHTVRPLNVTTSTLVSGPEALLLLADGPVFRPLLEVRKETNSPRETHVRVEGGVQGADVVGEIVLRVAVGSPRRNGNVFDELKTLNPLVTYDPSDPGAGYYYAELFYEGTCGPVAQP